MTIGVGSPNPSGIPGFNATTITAGTTQTQAGATQLPAFLNNVIVLNAGDGVILPPGFAGAAIGVNNNSANALQVYGAMGLNGALSDTIAAAADNTQVAGATGVSQPAGAMAVYYCIIGEGGNTNAPTRAQWKQGLLVT